jgi:hypothetical protein
LPAAGVVDENVDRADCGPDARDDLRHRLLVGHIKHSGEGAARPQGLELGPRGLIPDRADDPVTGRQRLLCQSLAQSGADSREKIVLAS